jgi:hypothetical protein
VDKNGNGAGVAASESGNSNAVVAAAANSVAAVAVANIRSAAVAADGNSVHSVAVGTEITGGGTGVVEAGNGPGAPETVSADYTDIDRNYKVSEPTSMLQTCVF